MRFLADLPQDRPVATIMLLISLMVLGFVAIFQLPLDFMPTVERPMVQAFVNYPGSQPLENLRQIVEPLEEEMATVSQVDSMYSQAQPGTAFVEARFDWDVDLDVKKIEVREAVDRAIPNLPTDVTEVIVQTFQTGPGDGAMIEARIAAKRDLSQDWSLLEQRIRRPLERIRGIAKVDLGGVSPQQVRIEIDPDALRRHGVTPAEVVRTMSAAHLDLDAGALRSDVLRYDVRTRGRFTDLAEIRALPLGRDDGLRLGDVAAVEIREPFVDFGRRLDGSFAISLQVFKEPSANTVEAADAVMARIAEIQQDPQLKGIDVLVWNNAGVEIRRALAGLRDAGIFGGLLVVCVLFAFLRRARTTMVVAVAIPFSLLVTCGVMFMLGAQFNVLTMMGLMLGVGMLVDNAVVVMENIHRLQDRGVDAVEAARRGTRQVVLAVIAATATTVCVWAWLFFQGRSQMTIYMGQVALTICSAVVCSLIISLTFIPLATARFVPSQPSAPGWIMRRLVPAYRAVLRWTLRHRLVTLIVLLLLASTAALPIIKIEKSGEPKEQQLFAQVFFRSQDPTTKEAMEAHVVKMESWVEANRDTLDFDSLYSWFTERGMGVVRLYLKPEDATDAKVAELTAAMRAGLPPIAGLRYEFGQNRWWNRGSGNRRMVSVALHGEDPEYLQRLAAEVEPALLTLPDAIDAFGRATNGLYEAQVRIDPERARTLGVSPQQVAETVSLTYRGRNLRRFQRDATELEMLVMLPEDLQPGLASLEDLPIARDLPLPGALRIDPSDTVPLGAVADVAVARADVEIQREDRQTSVWLTVEFDKDALTTDEARARVATFMDARDFPEGYGWGWGRWGRDRDNNLATMLIGVALSLATVMLLMAALFESFTQPLAIVITLPLAFFGSFWVLWLGGYELDIAAFMGVIILIGIVVNNGIVLVDRVNQLRGQGMARETALLQGCGDRLRPVMMTAISTIVGLAPLAYSGFTVAMAVVDSLAVAVIGGLATSTLFTLIGLPVWYVTLEDLGQGFLRALPRRTPAALPASSSSSAAAGG